MTVPSEAAIQAVRQALIDERLAPDNSVHGWRCSYPEMYGPCDCVDEVTTAVLAAALPALTADIANQIADAIDERLVHHCSNDEGCVTWARCHYDATRIARSFAAPEQEQQ